MHIADEMTGVLVQRLGKQGYRSKITSIAHIKELQKEIGAHHQKGLLDGELFDKYLANFNFECQKKIPEAKSLIIVSVPQPQVRVTFNWEGKSYPVIIPPTYAFSTDKRVADFIEAYLGPEGYQLKIVKLPEKLLAARTRLALYGRNNITYVEAMGSFHRPVVFISDIPCAEDNWGEPAILEHCEKCSACKKACPTDAIGSDRFLLHAERCLTFHNEHSNDFPDWLLPTWHNSLVGCMICQKVCPANKDVLKWIESGATFDREETALILDSVSDDRLPRETFEKLKKQGMMEYYDVLGRNLRVLIEQQIRKR